MGDGLSVKQMLTWFKSHLFCNCKMCDSYMKKLLPCKTVKKGFKEFNVDEKWAPYCREYGKFLSDFEGCARFSCFH